MGYESKVSMIRNYGWNEHQPTQNISSSIMNVFNLSDIHDIGYKGGGVC